MAMFILFRLRRPSLFVRNHFSGKKYAAGTGLRTCWNCRTTLQAESLAVEEWRTSDEPTEELFKRVRSVKGVGPYAAGNILKLLGRYDYLGLDSWCRGKFYELFKKGRKVKDSTIEKYYAPFGKWRGLFLWMDATKDWHTKEFPF